jgi:hypothetical protein
VKVKERQWRIGNTKGGNLYVYLGGNSITPFIPLW